MSWRHTHTITFCPLDGSPCREWAVQVVTCLDGSAVASTVDGREDWRWWPDVGWRFGSTWRPDGKDGDVWIGRTKTEETRMKGKAATTWAKVKDGSQVGYRGEVDGVGYSLVRSALRPERLYVMDETLRRTTLNGFEWFSDVTGEPVGVSS